MPERGDNFTRLLRPDPGHHLGRVVAQLLADPVRCRTGPDVSPAVEGRDGHAEERGGLRGGPEFDRLAVLDLHVRAYRFASTSTRTEPPEGGRKGTPTCTIGVR